MSEQLSLEKKRCQMCKKVKEPDQICSTHTIESETKKYIYHYCRTCIRARAHKYQNSDKGKKVLRKAVDKYKKKHKNRQAIWNKARYVKEKKPCEVCGSNKFVHKHHDDYRKPLSVRFLCATHHKEHHRKYG